MRLPLLVPAFFSAMLTFVMLYICTYRHSVESMGLAEKASILIIAAFFAWLAFTFVRIAFRDFYKEIAVTGESISFVTHFRSIQLAWGDIKNVSETASTLLITANDGRQVGIGADVTGYEELKEHVKRVVGQNKMPK
jgi:hypothetical protein